MYSQVKTTIAYIQPFLTHPAKGGYDPRVEDNVATLKSLLATAKSHKLSIKITTPETSRHTIPASALDSTNPDITFLLNFTTSQRSALLTSKNTLALLYTPTNEHFGIVPVEAMFCGVPVLACNTGGPTESIVDYPNDDRTGWLCPPDAQTWADALSEIIDLGANEREQMGVRSKARARALFGMEAMAERLDKALTEANSMGAVDVWRVWLLLVFVALLMSKLFIPL